MRQLFIKVPEGYGDRVLELADKSSGINPAQLRARDQSGTWDFVIVHVSNHQVETMLKDLNSLPKVQITLNPYDILPMNPQEKEVAEEVTDVSLRSPIEVWIRGLQSIGAWKGFLGYTIAASFVVWIGMFTNTIFLLVAAMLIAPFAGPAMNVAIATASGDSSLLWRNLLRYTVSILLMIGLAALLSLVMGLRTATSTMVNISEVSSVSVLLPLAAGAAGALNLFQTDRSSLVSGTAVGLLVAASLAPPAGLIGMAGALGRWDMSMSGVFILVQQLLAINLSGTLVLRALGMRPDGARYQRGKAKAFWMSISVTGVLLVLTVAGQFWSPPTLQRSTVAGRAAGLVDDVLKESDLAKLVEANTRFTRPSIENQNTLLGIIYVQRQDGVDLSNEEIRTQLAREITERLRTLGNNVVPMVDVVILNE